MTHNEKRTTWIKEGGIGLATGVLFGLTNVVIGHVFDYLLLQLRKSFFEWFDFISKSLLIQSKQKCKLKKDSRILT